MADKDFEKMLNTVLQYAKKVGWDVDVIREGDFVNGMILGKPEFIETAVSYLPEPFITGMKKGMQPQ